MPLWRLLGGRSERLLAYASSGELLEPAARVERFQPDLAALERWRID